MNSLNRDTNATIKQAIHHYHTSCENIAGLFRDTYFGRSTNLHNIGEEFGGVWGVGHYFFTLSNMAFALEKGLTKKEVIAYFQVREVE